jgi:hypothetical protein
MPSTIPFPYFETIRLVANDFLPTLTLTLLNQDDTPIDLTGASQVLHKLRKVGTTTILSTTTMTVLVATSGTANINFASGELNVAGGRYEGEIEITFANGTLTVPTLALYIIREDF